MILLLTFCSVFSFLDGLSPKKVETQFVTVPLNVTVVANTTAILPCQVDGVQTTRSILMLNPTLNSDSILQVAWMNPWRILISTGVRRVTDDTRMSIERPYVRDWNLHIRNIRYTDVGYYTCSIDTEPVQVRRIYLNVQVPPKIDDGWSSHDTTVLEGKDVELICNATGHPYPVITWTRKNVHDEKKYCDGIYECRADNGIDPPAFRQIRVDVEFPPEIHLLNRRQGQLRGKETILDCHIIASPQAYSIWKRNGKALSSSGLWRYRTVVYEEKDEHKVTLSLTIMNLENADFGEYTCEAANARGRDRETMVLYEIIPTTVKPPPTTTTEVSRMSTRLPKPNRIYTPDYQTIPRRQNDPSRQNDLSNELISGGMHHNGNTVSKSMQIPANGISKREESADNRHMNIEHSMVEVSVILYVGPTDPKRAQSGQGRLNGVEKACGLHASCLGVDDSLSRDHYLRILEVPT
ncbi:hypothetical protein ScPMuIL_018559 [Solemya velum]